MSHRPLDTVAPAPTGTDAVRREPGKRPRYLFIRILEACNADCFMCDYALSRDRFRFPVEDFRALMPTASEAGVRFVRFTGGEPLMHPQILELVRIGADHGMKMSVITNGSLLPRFVDALADAGLAQVIVSLDGASPATHDLYRAIPGLFDKAVEGLRRARELGLITRVNSVVGPHNYAQMPELQRVLTEFGVQQWELSPLKLEREIVFPDPAEVVRVCEPIYQPQTAGALVPLGRRFYGDSPAEQELFFQHSITPRPSEPLCHVVDDVIYIDGKNSRAFGCSCLPHRSDDGPGGAPVREGRRLLLDTPAFRDQVAHFRTAGPRSCAGCSTTAAGYSDDVARFGALPDWSY